MSEEQQRQNAEPDDGKRFEADEEEHQRQLEEDRRTRAIATHEQSLAEFDVARGNENAIRELERRYIRETNNLPREEHGESFGESDDGDE